MLVPRDDSIKLGQKFIISERAWFVDEYDATSAPGVTYYSLTEDKIDRLDDDAANELANYKDEGKYSIVCDDVICTVESTHTILPVVYNQGAIEHLPLKFILHDDSIAAIAYSEDQAVITGKAAGTTTLRIALADQPHVYKIINITVSDEAETNYVFVGNDYIKVTQSCEYRVHVLNDSNTIDPITTFDISDTTLANGNLKDGILTLTANEENKLGTIVLTVNTESGEYTKNIRIRPLW